MLPLGGVMSGRHNGAGAAQDWHAHLSSWKAERGGDIATAPVTARPSWRLSAVEVRNAGRPILPS
jgi:hypothetical protein